MITVAEARRTRALEKLNGKFHIAHFPIGTVVEVESPTNGFIHDESQRPHPDHMYHRTTHTVAGVVNNGPDSWLIERAEKCKLGDWLDVINISWVRRIVKRGDGQLYGEEKAEVERIRALRNEFLNRYDRPRDPRMEMQQPSYSKGTYMTYSITELVRLHLNKVYNNRDEDHLYDIDKLTQIVVGILKPRWTGFAISINKKRFARAMKQAMAKGKVSRKKRASDEYKAEMKRWEKEMEHDYANGDL